MRGLGLTGLTLFVSVGAPPASADDGPGSGEPRPLVLIGAGHAARAVLPSLQVDLAMLGFAAQSLPSDALASAGAIGAALTGLARARNAAAAIWIGEPDPSAGAPHWPVVVADRVTGKTVSRDFALRDARGDAHAPRVLSQRIVELLRASFRELAQSPRPAEGELLAPPAVRALAGRPEPRSPRIALLAGGAVAGLAGADGLHGGLWLSAQVAATRARADGPVTSPWSVGLSALVPVSGTVLRAAEGSARLSSFLATLDATRRLGPTGARAPWSAEVGFGLGALHLGARGAATPPYLDADDRATRAVALARLGARVRLGTSWLHLRLDVHGGLAVPRTAVRFAERSVAVLGGALALATLGLEARLP